MTLRTLTLTAVVVSASALAWLSPAAAAPMGVSAGSIPAIAQAQQDKMVIQVQRRGRGGFRGGRRGGRGGGVGAGVAAGVAVGIIGGMIAAGAAQHQQAVEYCMRRYRSYDPESGTYLGFDGLRHPCP